MICLADPAAHLENVPGGPRKRVNHSSAGALLAVERFGFRFGRLLAYPIAGHHSGLPDWIGEGARTGLKDRLAEKSHLERARAGQPPRDILDAAAPSVPLPDGADCALWVRMLASALFDVDFLDAEEFFDPAQLYKPTRTAKTIKELADTFNESHIGVLFNAYNPTTGEGVLFGNNVARERMKTEPSISILSDQKSRDPRMAKPSGREQAILAITPKAIESALWLSLYGFADIPNRQMDGAYHRSCIVSELHNFDRVIVCRPLANGWSGDTWPKSYFDVQDWNTEMWFSVGYKAEVDAMKRINSLIASGAINDPSYRLVDIHEVEPTTPAGYFNYFIERGSVFEEARSNADALFRWLKSGKIGQKP